MDTYRCDLSHDGTDDRRVQIVRRLRASGHAAFDCVTVDVTGTELWIRGTVGSYYAKQMASEFCRSIVPELTIRNALVVTYPEDRQDGRERTV